MLKIKYLLSTIVLCSVVIFSQTKSSKNQFPRFSSVYTDLNKDCKYAFNRQEAEEAEARGQDIPLRCKGFGGYYIYIYFSAESSIIKVNNNRDDSSIHLASQNLDYDREKDRKIEWRLANGKPFAVIFRISNYNPPADVPIGETHFDAKYKIGESLLVKGLKGFQQKVDFETDAKTPNANAKAQKMADNAY